MGFIARILAYALDIYCIMVLVHVLLSCALQYRVIPEDNDLVQKIRNFLIKYVEPALERIRLRLPPDTSVDLSPAVLFVICFALQLFLVGFF